MRPDVGQGAQLNLGGVGGGVSGSGVDESLPPQAARLARTSVATRPRSEITRFMESLPLQWVSEVGRKVERSTPSQRLQALRCNSGGEWLGCFAPG
ncbi:hypothetical protein SDC9_152630 [bioreactor metagenome]|uniref:Uncharacterized protein n=1 Tax=bioreactor metagenome TaxID=1076179 RepID=A0A645EVA7_9ZZZZ